MNLDSAGATHQRLRQRPAENAPQQPGPRLAEHDLRHVLAPREPQDFARVVAALEPHRLPAQTLGEAEHLGELIGALGVARLTDGLDGDRGPGRVEAGGELARPPDDPLGNLVRPDAGEQALGGRPRAFDRLLAQVVDHLVVDPVGGAAQRQFAQRGQIAGGEKALGRPPGGLRHIDLAFVQPLNELVGREVDQNDVARLLQEPVRDGLAHDDAGNPRDDVGEALEMLDIERRPNIDSGREKLLDVLPALGMAAFRRVGVGEFVDDDQLGLARQRGVEIEFLDRAAAILDLAPRQDFQPLDQRAGFGAAVRFDEPDDDVDAFFFQAPRVLQHRVGLPDAGRCAEEHLQPARGFPAERRQQRVRVGASVVGSARLGHRRSSVVTTILADPAPNSAAKR